MRKPADTERFRDPERTLISDPFTRGSRALLDAVLREILRATDEILPLPNPGPSLVCFSHSPRLPSSLSLQGTSLPSSNLPTCTATGIKQEGKTKRYVCDEHLGVQTCLACLLPPAPTVTPARIGLQAVNEGDLGSPKLERFWLLPKLFLLL